MKKVLSIITALAALALASVSCSKERTPLSYEGDTVLNFTAMGGTKLITVKGEDVLTLTPSHKWITATAEKNDVKITVKTATDAVARNGELTVSNGIDNPIVFQIKQEGAQFEFDPEESYTLPLAGGQIEIPYTTNLDFEISTEAAWLKIEKKADKVVLSAKASTTANNATVSYTAGSNFGSFTVAQFDPVEVSLDVFLKEWSKNFTKKNTVSFTAKGKNITAGALNVVSADIFAGKTEEEWIESLKDDTVNALEADDITDINSKEGYTNGIGGKKDNTEYYVVLYVTNGPSEKLVYGSVTTEAETDPIQKSYSLDDLIPFQTKEDMYGTYDLYASGYIWMGEDPYNWASFTRSSKLGTVTISDGGSEEYQGETYEYVKVSGFYAPYVSSINKTITAGHANFADEDLIWAASESKDGWYLFPEPGPLVNEGTSTSPKYAFYEFLAGGNGALLLMGDIDNFYPVVGAPTESGIVAFCDTGAMDDFEGFDSWYLCGIEMEGHNITALTGQHLSLTDWILVPQKTPGSKKFVVSPNCYRTFVRKAAGDKVNAVCTKKFQASKTPLKVK